MMKKEKGSILGATFLVTGTCIGGGILALPVATGAAGFFPSLFLMFLGWLFMTITALFLAEINLWMEEGVHFVTMASRLLGPLGKAAAWILYLFIGYASLVAYTAGGAALFDSGIQKFFGIALSPLLVNVVFVCIFGFIVYMGNVFVGRINTMLMVGLILSYCLLIGSSSDKVVWQNLIRNDWGSTLIAVPLLLTIFSFQSIVPSLTYYLQRDGRALRFSIIIGTTIAFVVYLIWQWLVLGTVLLDGDYGLAKALAMGKPATEFLGVATNSQWIQSFADFFAFFALITSFLGIALGLFDFLADGLKISRKKGGSITLILLVVVPTLFFALTMEKAFLTALDSSGGIGDSLLNGFMPALMLWVGRYHKKYTSDYQLPGGKPLLSLIMFWALFVLAIEILGKFGLIMSLT